VSTAQERLEAAAAELAEIDRQALGLLGACHDYLEDLGRCGHIVADVVADQIQALEDRRSCLTLELGELARDVDDERGRCSGSIGDDD
jgi:predicted metal-dependent hydrolase